ncbi:MAG: hypothetical protein NVS1B12_16160 [Acidimicrobiales bacterium]
MFTTAPDTVRGMQLSFDPEDEAGFFAARDALLDRFATAVNGGRRDDDLCFDVTLALDWKWGYGDADLGRWTRGELEEFLIEWCPRKVSMPPEEARSIPASLTTFLEFLDREGLLDPTSDALPALRSHLRTMGDRAVAAMGDPRRYGMAKSLVSGMGGLGETVDGERLEQMMAEFNALPRSERDRILGGAAPAGFWQQMSEAVELPPAAPIPADELAALARATPVLTAIDAVRDFVGPGRKLTAKGNLTVADAKALAAILGDPALAQAAEYGWAIRSADQLGRTQFVLRWARAAGALRVAHSKLLTTASWAKLRPAAALARAVEVLFDHGPVALRQGDGGWRRDALTEVIDEGSVSLLAALWAHAEPLDFEEMLEMAAEACEMQVAFAHFVTEESRRRQIRVEVDALFDVLGDAGRVVRAGEESETDTYGIVRRRGGTLVLTGVARAVLSPIMAANGFEIAVPGELTDRPLVELFDRIGSWHPERTRVEFDVWVAAHSPPEAVDQLVGVLSHYTDPQWPVAVMDLAGRLGPELEEATVRKMLDTPARGHAMGWFSDADAPDVEIDPEAMLRAGVELMSMHAGGDADDELLELIGNIDDLDGFIDDVWPLPIPAAAVVLEGIGRVHPDKGVAKAARKAVFRHRSKMANLGPDPRRS